MSLSLVAQIVLALSKAIPIVNKWLDEIYNARIEAMKERNDEAIKTGFEQQDQRPIEDAMNSSKTGEISGVPGSEIVDKLPGVN